MALNQSPSIVTNGLVYYHDMGNTQKSWKGAPTTNVIQTDLNLYDKDNGCTVTQLSETFEGNPIYRVVFPSGTLPRIRTTFSYTTGQQFTGSIYYKVVTQGSDTPQLWFRENGFGTVYVSTPLSSTTWQRANISHTFSSSGTSMFLLYQSNSLSTAPTIIDFSMPQTELGSFATPFIAGTRTTSQAIVDLTNTNTVTANSLTYASDNTFSFNGSSTYASIPENSVFNTQTPTVEVWIKTNATTQKGFFFEKGTVNSQYALFQEGANLTWRQFLSGSLASLTAPAATYINTSQYAQVVGTFTTGDRRMYVNGVQVASDAAAGTFTTNANGCSIGVYGGFTGAGGRGYYFNGNIGIVKVYNRALSAAEVKQNFNALKGRYGL